ncbi:Hypothetical_protein [Hexamita inflata]|uniref:Hypothetical_protein n=1 Tax=Hexamita inflata TaxID=28002 RepID=A0ABP1KHZ8_9EUKA
MQSCLELACRRLNIYEDELYDHSSELLIQRATRLQRAVNLEMQKIQQFGLTECEQLVFPDLSSTQRYKNQVQAKSLIEDVVRTKQLQDRIDRRDAYRAAHPQILPRPVVVSEFRRKQAVSTPVIIENANQFENVDIQFNYQPNEPLKQNRDPLYVTQFQNQLNGIIKSIDRDLEKDKTQHLKVTYRTRTWSDKRNTVQTQQTEQTEQTQQTIILFTKQSESNLNKSNINKQNQIMNNSLNNLTRQTKTRLNREIEEKRRNNAKKLQQNYKQKNKSEIIAEQSYQCAKQRAQSCKLEKRMTEIPGQINNSPVNKTVFKNK